MLLVAGHLGATLTHGEGYLTEHAPAPLRGLLAQLLGGGGPALRVHPSRSGGGIRVLVQPMLQARCVKCHGAAKTEGKLRLDRPDGIRKGGKDGPVFVAGQAAKSEIVRRIWLPASHKDVMPPRGQPGVAARGGRADPLVDRSRREVRSEGVESEITAGRAAGDRGDRRSARSSADRRCRR